ncbi:hypothetical protein AXF42_Ash019443 [Apostasia shenzhenica]|uniref:Uncharacterized protein n=1 Tax=Apostasia shenzhenica TaxID=1088818 RepID=A0A2I0AYC1_9ASPA|nr:hypothetical protein AXF42_Ash019443 [Apostasia shenzhenica]
MLGCRPTSPPRDHLNVNLSIRSYSIFAIFSSGCLETQDSSENLLFVRGYHQIPRSTTGGMQSREYQGPQKAYAAARAPGDSKCLRDGGMPTHHTILQ